MLNKTSPAARAAALSIACALAGFMAAGTASPTWARTAAGAAPSASSAAAGPASAERTVEVKLTEYAIEMPHQLTAGRTLFKVTNTGEMFHRFEIEGKGIEEEVESGIDAGQTKTLELNLEPGSYEVYCPVRGHKKAGMFLKVQVG